MIRGVTDGVPGDATAGGDNGDDGTWAGDASAASTMGRNGGEGSAAAGDMYSGSDGSGDPLVHPVYRVAGEGGPPADRIRPEPKLSDAAKVTVADESCTDESCAVASCVVGDLAMPLPRLGNGSR